MSWNRTKYDQCAYQKELSQSTSPINYTLDPNKFFNCNECRPDFGLVAGNNVSLAQTNMVDLESDLFGITRQNTKCPERKYLPHCHKCDEISGLPCGGETCKRAEKMDHLPECKIIQYSPRIDHVGYDIKYPHCAVHGTKITGFNQEMIYPPQLNPTHYTVK